MWKKFLSKWILITSILAFHFLKTNELLLRNVSDTNNLFVDFFKFDKVQRKNTERWILRIKPTLSKTIPNTFLNNKANDRTNRKRKKNAKRVNSFKGSYVLKAKENEIEENVFKNYKIFDRKNYIKKYDVTGEEIEKYTEQLKQSRTSGYEPQFPKDAFRTPDGLTNVILNYKYKNDNLKIHNYYYFFIYFLKKITENVKNEEKVISVQDFLFLKKKGFFEGEIYTWKNWIILNKGEWKDFLDSEDYDIANFEIKTLRKMVEPKMKRMPIEYWGSFRAIDFNINHYPIYKKIYDYFNKKKIAIDEPKHIFYPFIFFPRFSVLRDRGGLGYGDANFFGNYGDIYEYRKKREKKKIEQLKLLEKLKNEKKEETDIIVSTNLKKEFFIDPFDFGPNNIKIEEATDIIKYPQNGRLYQKFYIGPLNITDGHTFGSLLKYVCQSQIYGYAIVAIKIHNMNEDTTISNVQEDLLEIGLNMSDVCVYSKEQNIETNIRLRFKGPLMLVAGMIPLPSHLQIVNKEQYICTIKEGGMLDISIKIEYGKGHWVTYEKGLYKKELGSDNECMKKRPVHEVIHKNYTPITTSFGACRMVRITVHKIATKYWCEDRCEFTDPKQMLVIEIWNDPRMLPKNTLLYGIKNIKKICTKLRQMILDDTDFSCEEEEQELKKLWGHIDSYKLLKRRQKDEGGPPIINLDDDLEDQINKANTTTKKEEKNTNNAMNPFLQNLVNPENFPKHSNIVLPLRETPPPFLDTLEWLKQEVKKEKKQNAKRKQSEKSNILAKGSGKGETKVKGSENGRKKKKIKTFNYDEFLNERLQDILCDDSKNYDSHDK